MEVPPGVKRNVDIALLEIQSGVVPIEIRKKDSKGEDGFGADW